MEIQGVESYEDDAEGGVKGVLRSGGVKCVGHFGSVQGN
jgi:hypothetical protein